MSACLFAAVLAYPPTSIVWLSLWSLVFLPFACSTRSFVCPLPIASKLFPAHISVDLFSTTSTTAHLPLSALPLRCIHSVTSSRSLSPPGPLIIHHGLMASLLLFVIVRFLASFPFSMNLCSAVSCVNLNPNLPPLATSCTSRALLPYCELAFVSTETSSTTPYFVVTLFHPLTVLSALVSLKLPLMSCSTAQLLMPLGISVSTPYKATLVPLPLQFFLVTSHLCLLLIAHLH